MEKEYNSLAKVLLESGSNPFIVIDGNGNNAAIIALQKNNKDLLADIVKFAGTLSDIQGNTILHYAARLSTTATVRDLLSYGLDTNVRNIYDETPYVIAVRWKRSDLASLLKPKS